MPALWVGNGNGALLEDAGGCGAAATLTLDSPMIPNTSTDNLWTVLPGETDDVIIVNTHSDGCNALEEEDGMIGVVALARYFAKRTNQKTIVFLLTTGHFGHGLVPGAQTWRSENPDLMSRAAACVTLEHLGSTEWLDDPATGKFEPTGKNQFGWAYTPLPAPGSVFLQSVGGTGAQRAMAVRPLSLYFGEGSASAAAGIPTISYLTGPSYLFTSPPGGEISKLNPAKFYGEVVTFARCVQALDAMSPATLSRSGGVTFSLKWSAVPAFADGAAPCDAGPSITIIRSPLVPDLIATLGRRSRWPPKIVARALRLREQGDRPGRAGTGCRCLARATGASD